MSKRRHANRQTTGQATWGTDNQFVPAPAAPGRDEGTDTGTFLEKGTDMGMETSRETDGETGSAGATWKDQAVEMKDQALDTSQKVLAQTMAQTKASAGQAIDRAKDQVKSQITSQKDRTVEGLSGAVRALESTGQQFRNEDLALVANYADSLTGQVRRASDYLSERSVDDIARDVEGFARKNPSLFIGGAFVLGIALARFLRSSEMATPFAAFSTDKDALPLSGQPALSSPLTTPMNSPITSPMANMSGDDFGERPMTTPDYAPSVAGTGTDLA